MRLAVATIVALLAFASPAFASPVTNLTVVNANPSRAAGARTQYAVGFTTSATGGLSSAANSRINVTFPAGTTFTGYTSGIVRNATRGRRELRQPGRADHPVLAAFGPEHRRRPGRHASSSAASRIPEPPASRRSR